MPAWRLNARALVRATLFLTMTGAGVAVLLMTGWAGARVRLGVRRLWCRGCLRILGLDVQAEGTAFDACATLHVANHVSYLDIIVIGAFTNGTFIAKSEVAGWLLFGFLAKLGRTVFIRRYWRDAVLQRNLLVRRMCLGESMILFAEGTSSNGLAVLPFKSALMSVAEPWVSNQAIAVQALTLRYARLDDGTPIDPGNAHLYAWVGDDLLLPHLWRVLRMPGAQIELVYGRPVMSWDVRCRKRLTRELQAEVSETLQKTTRASRGALSVPPQIAWAQKNRGGTSASY